MKVYVANEFQVWEGDLSRYLHGSAIVSVGGEDYAYDPKDCYKSKWLALASIERRLKTRLKKVQTEMDKIRIENPTEGE